MADLPLLVLQDAGVAAGSGGARRVILAGVNLRVVAGERVVVLGANGAGKSTLLKLCNGIVQPTAGSVNALPLEQQALIFQRTPLLRRTALDNLRFVLAVRGHDAAERTRLATDALAAAGLAEVAQQRATSLSGGEQQRLALARAWVCSPRLLLADEPTANLAPAATRDVERLLLTLFDLPRAQGGAGCALLLTTHNVAQARRLATRIVFLDGGRIVEDRPADEFFGGPVSPAARSYLEGESV